MDLLDVAEIAEIQIIDWSLWKHNSDFAFPNFSPQPQPQLDTTFAEPRSLLGRPSQLSVQGSLGGFSVSKRMHNVCVSISFPSRLWTKKTVVATDSLSNSAPFSWRPEEGPNINGTLPAAVFLLLLDSPELSKPSGLVGITVASSGHRKLLWLSGILIGVCSGSM